MIELISIVASLALCILIPIEVSKIRNGWVRKTFVGDRPKFLAAYRRQLNLLKWMGLVFGVLSVALAPLETHACESTVKVIAGIIWFVVAGICFSALRSLAKVGDTDPAGPPRMTGDGTTPCRCSSARWPGRSLSLD